MISALTHIIGVVRTYISANNSNDIHTYISVKREYHLTIYVVENIGQVVCT